MSEKEAHKALKAMDKINTDLRLAIERFDIAASAAAKEIRHVINHVDDLRRRMAQFNIDVQNVCKNKGGDDAA